MGNSNNQTVLSESESERQPGGWCIQSGTAALTLFQVLGSIVLLWYTRRQQRQRQRTSKLLPIYQVYIRLLMVITVLVSLIQLIDSVGFGSFRGQDPQMISYVYGMLKPANRHD